MNTAMRTPDLTVPVSLQRDHIRGPVDAPVTLLEYGDYECPYCGSAHEIVNAIRARMRDRLRFAFRHFPLRTLHPNAELAAEAAEAAGHQGKFWPMHDMLYENQQRLDAPDLLAYAASLGLDLEVFGDDLANRVHAPKVQDDLISGIRSGVKGTPSFYINGMRHDGAWDLATLMAALQEQAEPRKRARG
jgi:protein-disulfide isomerase